MSQFTLKLIALIAMLLDHLAKTVATSSVLTPIFGFELTNAIRTFMLTIGRIAFPIFAWFIAEGCRKSQNPVRYLLRLLIFAVLSEIPYQLCFCESISVGFHNVIFTLALSALAIWAGCLLKKYNVPRVLACLFPAAAALALGWALQTDYNAWGIALVLGIYYIPQKREKLLYLAAWITVYQLIFHGMLQSYTSSSLLLLYWIGGMFSVAFLAAYQGERGRGSKWLFYIFYPAHLLVLSGIALAL